MDSFEKQVIEKAQEPDIDWLVRKLLEKHRMNLALVKQNVELGGAQDVRTVIQSVIRRNKLAA